MEGVAIRRKLVFVAGTADRRRLRAEFGFRGLQNGVCCVAVGADWSLQIPRRHRVTVRAALVVIVDLRVAGSARLGDVCLVGRARRVLVAQDSVRSMTALAVGGDQKAFLAESKTVDRVHVVRVDARQTLL